MICPICKTEMRIADVRQEVSGDMSPDTQTEIYTVQDLVCRNKQCTGFDRVMQSVKTKIYP